MIRIKKAKDLFGNPIELTIRGTEERIIDASGLTLLPAAIDGHVHFRNPGFREKETWKSGAKAAFAGGITTVFDMPNTFPATTSLQLLREKRALIEKELRENDLPLRAHFYFGATAENAREISLLGTEAIGIKVFMGSSTGSLLVDDERSLEEIFRAAAAAGKVVALHAEDEAMIRERKALFAGIPSPSVHSLIRSEEVAAKAIRTALALCRKTGCTLYFLHISAEEELELIAKAKQEGLPVYAEATPHHLFFSTDAYEIHGTKVQMNPPLRAPHHQKALWDALRSGVIDTIGSDHAPHPLHEKLLPYGRAPSGVPGVETTLPLLLTACKEGKISPSRLLSALRYKIEEFFPLPKNDDWVLVDLETKRKVEEKNLSSLAGWSPYDGYELTGWPQITIAQGKLIYASQLVAS